MKKVNSPSRKEVQATTTVVIITVFLFAFYFWMWIWRSAAALTACSIISRAGKAERKKSSMQDEEKNQNAGGTATGEETQPAGAESAAEPPRIRI